MLKSYFPPKILIVSRNALGAYTPMSHFSCFPLSSI